MKFFLALALFVGVALSSSSSHYGWVPEKEFHYRFQSQVLSGIPEISTQFSGLKISSEVLVQTGSDYTLTVKFLNPKFIEVNHELNTREGVPLVPEPRQELPEGLRRYLTTPFLVNLKRGVVQSFFVEEGEPIVVSNIKKALLSQLQMDLSASRRSDILRTNSLPSPTKVEELISEEGKHAFFSTEETTLSGDCQNDYNVWPMPEHESKSIESRWIEEEIELRRGGYLSGPKSEGSRVCEGKRYWTITKTENLDNCRERPVFSIATGLKTFCDYSKASCKDLFTHTGVTRYIVCGTSPKDFVIREAITENSMASEHLGYNTEKMVNTARINLFLVNVKESGSFSPLPRPSSSGMEKSSLIMEYPLGSEWSSESSIKPPTPFTSTSGSREEFEPIIKSKPSLTKPSVLVPSGLSYSEIKREVLSVLESVVEKLSEEPETCGKKANIPGKIASITAALRHLSLEELKELESTVSERFSSKGEGKKLLAIHLFNDILSMTGTNPSVMLIKRIVLSGKVTGGHAITLIQSTIRNVRTPTEELLSELVSLVKSLKTSSFHGYKAKMVYSTAIQQLSGLLYHACVNPSTSVTMFPVRIYGRFCTKETSVLREYISYLTSELESTSSEGQKLALVTGLGKLGHKDTLITLSKVIEGKLTTKSMTRSVAVYSLKSLAKREPTVVRPILLSLINNLSENTEVRIAAVSVLPWCQPTTADLQRIASRTWLEPSKQVASFIFSTLKNLPETTVPELKVVGLKAKNVISHCKPFEYGIQYSMNTHWNKFMTYKRIGASLQTSQVKTGESLFPVRSEVKATLYGSENWKTTPFSFTMYTQGMDTIINKIIEVINGREVSSTVEEELKYIKEKLSISRRMIKTPEVFTKLGLFGMETSYFGTYEELMEEVVKSLSGYESFGPSTLDLTRTFTAYEKEVMMPTPAGFPFVYRLVAPTVVSVKTAHERSSSSVRKGLLEIFNMGWETEMTPVFNGQSLGYSGIVNPITGKVLGSGSMFGIHSSLPVKAKATVSRNYDLSVTLKMPTHIKSSVELLHAYMMPFTFVKSLKTVEPVTRGSSVKEILTGKPLRKFEKRVGEKLGLVSNVELISDVQSLDTKYIYDLVKEQGIFTIGGLFPRSVKLGEVKINFMPEESETKEIKLKFGLATGLSQGLKGIKLGGLFSGIESSLKVQEGFSSEYEIKKSCEENYMTSHEVDTCIREELSKVGGSHSGNVIVDERIVERICHLPYYKEEHRRICREGIIECERALNICIKAGRYDSLECAERKNKCHRIRLIVERMNHMSLNSEIEEGSTVTGLHMGVSMSSGYGNTKTIESAIVGSYHTSGRTISTLFQILFQTPSSPMYEVVLGNKIKTPEILSRWDIESLLKQSIEVEWDSELTFGRVSGPKTTFNARSTLKKSEKQISSVERSNEYKKCKDEERSGRYLSPVCSETRHQAASLDSFTIGFSYPKSFVKSYPLLEKAANGLKGYFLTNVVLFDESSSSLESEIESSLSGISSSSYGNGRIILEGRVTRTGESGELKIMTDSKNIKLENIRIPVVVRGLFPFSVRNGVASRVIQKISRDQEPASCAIDNKFIDTFDNRTYFYELNTCEHLLFKDCSGSRPIAVTGRKDTGNNKVVKILSGEYKVELKETKSTIGGAAEVYVNGHIVPLRSNEYFIRRSGSTGRVVLRIFFNRDNVVTVESPVESLTVFFNPKRIEIVAPQRLHNRACGLCGDLNGENTADLKTPGKCLMSKDRFAAYSYMIKSGSCPGIPSSELSHYERDLSTCAKTTFIHTPIVKLASYFMETRPRPLTAKHLVRKEVNRVCISKKMVKVCSNGSTPVKTVVEPTPFTCFTMPSSKGEQLIKRAEAGESLIEVSQLPTVYTKSLTHTVRCSNEYSPRFVSESELSSYGSYRTTPRSSGY